MSPKYGKKLRLYRVLKNSYKTDKAPIMFGYVLDTTLSNDDHQIYFHERTNQLLMSVTGTRNTKDIGTDIALVGGHLKKTNRYKGAHQALRAAKRKYHVKSATVVGHSLGGAIAGYIASHKDKVISFNKGATVGQDIRSNEKAYRTEGDAVSYLNKDHPRMLTTDRKEYSIFGKILQHASDIVSFLKQKINGHTHLRTAHNVIKGVKKLSDVNDSHAVDNLKDNHDIFI
eukprot:gene8686-17936_t